MAHQSAVQYSLHGFANFLRVRISLEDTNCSVGPSLSTHMWAARAGKEILVQDGQEGSLL